MQTLPFGFLVDGVCARCAAAAAGSRWATLRRTARVAALAAALSGALATAALATALPAYRAVVAEGTAGAEALWWSLAASAPFELLVNAAAGVLSGNGRVGAAASLRISRALLATGGAAWALLARSGAARGLEGVGLAALGASLASAVLGWAMVQALPPADAPLGFSPLRAPLSGERARLLTEAAAATQQTPGEQDTDTDGAPMGEFMRKFATDGADMFVRSLLLKVSFTAALLVARSISAAALDAHAAVAQLWMLTSYIADGFATAGTVLAPRIAARRDEAAAAGDAAGAAEWAAALRVTCIKLCVGGGGVGVAAALVFWLCEGAVQSAFLGGDDAAVAYLHTWLWPMLCFSQVLNGVVFVQDGLLAAAQAWRYIRNFFLASTLLLFAPALAAGRTLTGGSTSSLAAIWLAKLLLNVGRAAAGGYGVARWLGRGVEGARQRAAQAAVDASATTDAQGRNGASER